MKYLRYLLIIFLLSPLSTFALEEIIVNCPDNIKKNENFKCEISGTAPYKVSAIEYEFELPNYIQKIDFKVDEYWQGTEEDNLAILYTDENKESPYRIGIITLKSSKDINHVEIRTKYLLLGDDDYNEHIIKARDVNDMKTEAEKENNKQNLNLKYGIIILIVVVIFMITLILIRKKVKK